jgi:hypothetical protein
MWLRIAVLSYPALLLAQPAPQPDTPDTSTQPGASEEGFRRFTYGAQIRWWTAQPFNGNGIEVGNATTSNAYNTTSASGRYALGPKLDFYITRRWSLSAGAFFQHFQYTKVTQQYTGTPTDGTLNKTLTEHTMAGYWDFPILVRYQFSGKKPVTTSSSGTSTPHFSFITQIPSHVFVEAGGSLRHLMTVRSGNDTLNSDSSTAYNEIPITPKHTTVEGATFGLGLRFVDEFNLKVTPEVRYTLWSSPLFESQSTLSRERQLEVGLSFTF